MKTNDAEILKELVFVLNQRLYFSDEDEISVKLSRSKANRLISALDAKGMDNVTQEERDKIVDSLRRLSELTMSFDRKCRLFDMSRNEFIYLMEVASRLIEIRPTCGDCVLVANMMRKEQL